MDGVLEVVSHRDCIEMGIGGKARHWRTSENLTLLAGDLWSKQWIPALVLSGDAET